MVLGGCRSFLLLVTTLILHMQLTVGGSVWGIDLFTDTVAILSQFDLRSIIGCPGGISKFRLYFRALFGTFFIKVFLE